MGAACVSFEYRSGNDVDGFSRMSKIMATTLHAAYSSTGHAKARREECVKLHLNWVGGSRVRELIL